MQKYLYYFLGIFTIFIGFYLWLGWSQLLGQSYVYSLDDVYIHLAISKNFAEYGSWSINPHQFDSASSSILYTLILSGLIKLFGTNIYYPMLVNIFFGYATVYLLYRFFKDFYGETELRLALVLFLPFTLLYVMTILGMEHSIHMFLMVLIIYLLKLNLNNNFERSSYFKFLICLFFVALVRFESMFLTCIVSFLLLYKKQWSRATGVILVGSIPIIIFGLISIKNGGYFFPNSVLIKAKIPSEHGFIGSLFNIFKNGILFNLNFYKYLFFPTCLIILYWIKVYYKKSNFKTFVDQEFISISILSVGLMQALFGELAFRYENYVMISVLLIITPIIIFFVKSNQKVKYWSFNKISSNIFILMILVLAAYRVYYHHPVLKVASKNIQEQQMEMARFINTYYKGEKVCANDIGAIAYFGNAQLLDLVGLGSTDVATFIMKNKDLPNNDYNTATKSFFQNYTKSHYQKIAVIYPEWFPGQIPDSWIPVMSWTIKNNRGSARDTVVWYAVDPKEALELSRNLSQFDLNSNVEQRWIK